MYTAEAKSNIMKQCKQLSNQGARGWLLFKGKIKEEFFCLMTFILIMALKAAKSTAALKELKSQKKDYFIFSTKSSQH